MTFELTRLPYALDALEPHISRRTMEFHHGKHHAAYVKKANELVKGTAYEQMAPEEVVLRSFSKPGERPIFNNAAQAWNHDFFWHCMQPDGGGQPSGELARLLQDGFGGYDQFRARFLEVATGQFGSGWAWLVLDRGKPAVVGTSGAENPLVSNQVPLLTCDVWEHAYYLDYQNQRPAFVQVFLDRLVNWKHVEERLRGASPRKAAPLHAVGQR